jgi:hypothetical protein
MTLDDFDTLTIPTLPLLLIAYHNGMLGISDSNHRHEAMRRRGWRTCRVLIRVNSVEDYHGHTPQLMEAGIFNEAS